MAFNSAAKVGLATIVAVAVLAGGVAWLTQINFGPKGYHVTVTYKDVDGLLPGAKVMLMGVRVGTVDTIEPQDHLVLAHVHVLSPNTHIAKNGRFMIMSQGLIGEMSIEIFPAKEPAFVAGGSGNGTEGGTPVAPTPLPTATPEPVYLVNGDVVRGDDPQRLALVMEEMSDTFNDFRKGTDPKKFQELFAKTADNLVQTTATIRRIGDKTETILGGFNGTPAQLSQVLASIRGAADSAGRVLGSANPRQVREVVANLRTLSNSLNYTYKDLFGEEHRGKETQSLTRSVRSLAVQLDHLATTMNVTTGDPKVQSDIRDTIKNIRLLTQGLSGASQLASAPAKALPTFALSPRIQGLAANTPDGTGIAANLGLHVKFGTNYLMGSVEQVGQGNYLDLLFGRANAWNGLGYEAGLIRSKIGLGVDYDVNTAFHLTGEVYDPFHLTTRIGLSYFPTADGQYGLVGQAARTFDQNLNFLWLGVEWRPNL